jgi:hypothetical protein
MSTPLELIEKYAKEADLDTELAVASLRERLENGAQTKHKWLYRLVQSQRTLNELKDQKSDLIQAELGKDVLGMNKAIIKAKVEKSQAVYELNKKITDQELLVTYLDNLFNNVLGQSGYDRSKLVDYLKLEAL